MNRRSFLRASLLSATIAPIAGQLARARRQPVPGSGEQFKGTAVLDAILDRAEAEDWNAKPIGDLMGLIGLELRNTPYVAGTLELYDDREVCSANLLGLDCVTFFESVLGIARMIKSDEHRPGDLLAELTSMRYRDGKIIDYASRLHYTCEWFSDNDRKGLVDTITKSLQGSEKYAKHIDFMSTHVSAYEQLKENPVLVDEIQEVERRLNEETRYYLPKAQVKDAEAELRTGDIVAITTSIPGLDVSHTGLCYRDDKGMLRLLHASLTHRKVVLDTELSAYLAGNKKQTGIMVARPLEPVS